MTKTSLPRLNSRLFRLLVLLWAIDCSGVSADLHQEIQEVYSFQPHLLNQEQIDQRSAELDKFWTKAKANKDSYVPGLKKELADFSNPPFFLYDGSMLLLELADAPENRKIALAAVAHCDLRDVEDTAYFHWVHHLAAQGEDTTAAAFRILENPKFKVIVPQHALTLGQNYSLVYMLLPTDPQFWLQPALGRLKAEKDLDAQKSLLLLLWYAQTSDADQALQAFVADASRPDEARKYAQQFIDAARKAPATFLYGNEGKLRSKRQERMRAVSDEALIDLDQLTLQLLAARKH